MASSFEFALRMANPPTTSLASVKGPSVTLTLSPERLTRAPSAVGKHPSVASSQPALNPSSTNFPIVAISSGVGGVLRSTCLWILRNRIVCLQLLFDFVERSFCGLHRRVNPRSVIASNEGRGKRHDRSRAAIIFLRKSARAAFAHAPQAQE